MADNKGGTIYQNINKFLNMDSIGGNQNITTGTNASPNSQGRKIIIKGNTPEEIMRKGLELEQKQKLQDKFFRTTDRGFQKAMQYEAARLPSYIDFEGMEYYPIIASALDLFMEEATTIGPSGKMLNIYSNKERIKLVLEDFFYNIANVNVNLPFWVRNMCKYGDNFLNLYGEQGKGITSVRQLVNYEIERFERVQEGKMSVKFKERMTGDEFNTFEMAHFRLLGDDKMLPYGNSLLCKARRVFRMLVLAEDAMLTYRLIRAGEKKVFKIDVGNIDEDDVEEYMYKVSDKFKRTPQVDPNNGQIDYRFNVLGNDEDYFIPVRNANVQTGIDTLPGACLALDTKIELLDGRSLELKNIIDEYNSGEELWSYSINPETGEIVPGKITWAGVTRKDTDVLKITLDNGETITCTPDHKFNTRLGDIKEAKDLMVGESLWAFNKKFEKIKNGGKKTVYDKDYEMVFDYKINDWIYTHRLVNNYLKTKNVDNIFIYNQHYIDAPKTVVHHVNLNRYDNSPSNLVSMGYIDHFKYHSKIGVENMSNADMTERVKKLNAGFFYYYDSLTDSQKKARSENISKKRKKTLSKMPKKDYDEYCRKGAERLNTVESRDKLRLVMQTKEYKDKMRNNGKRIRSKEELDNMRYTYDDRLLNYIVNFTKINSRLESLVDDINMNGSYFKEVYDELNKNKKSFRPTIKFTRKTVLKLLRFFNYENWKDFNNKLTLYNHKVSQIEYLTKKQDTGTITIDGGEEFHNFHNFALSCGVFTKNSNLNDIADIQYLRENLMISLGVPKPFLSFQDASGGGKNLAQFDIRFAKKINRIQQAMIQELNKMAMIHLFYLGFDREDISNFVLSLTNPSTQQELLKVELMQTKAQVYTEMTRAEAGIAAMSHTQAKREILNMSDSQIVEDLRQQKMEKVIMQEFADSPVVIKKTGLFADIDKRYGADSVNMSPNAPSGTPPNAGGMSSAPSGGDIGMPTGGNVASGGIPPTTGEVPAPIEGLPNQTPAELPPLKENMDESTYNAYINKLVYGDKKEPIAEKANKIIMENDNKISEFNSKAFNLINEMEDIMSGELLTEKTDIEVLNEDDNIDLDKLNLEE